jgi:hypothetical protein
MKTIKCKKRYAMRNKDDGKFLREFGYADSLVDASLVDESYAKHVADIDPNIEIVAVEQTLHIISDNTERTQRLRRE